ncbi:MAG TPA: helix-turn-helix transcriptional regulator [Ramlibacter sp.]|nr:helix-turn-helix transcriptional regulator [Ramlibacter sp.]
MPAAAPAIAPADRERLIRLGERLRLQRKAQKVSAVATAEAAGISRVTLHRIESGEPGVAIGLWVAVAGALGLALELGEPASPPAAAPLPQRIGLEEYPQLRALAWQLEGVRELTPAEALALYERNWKHVDRAALSEKEAALVEALSKALGAGRLLV